MYTNIIYNENCLEGMKRIPNNFVDLTVTSPPYNFDVKYDTYKDNLSIEEYKKNVQALCNELYRVTKVGGRICINIPLVTKDYISGERICLDQLYQNCLDLSGLSFREKIIWNKKGVSKRNAWGSYMLPSCPWIVYPTEIILVYCKKNMKIQVNRELATITKDEFIKSAYNIWWIEKDGSSNEKHPAVMARDVARRLINFYSYKDAIVLDPYLGVGTTCIVAHELQRRYIGFEISEKYFCIAKKELNIEQDD